MEKVNDCVEIEELLTSSFITNYKYSSIAQDKRGYPHSVFDPYYHTYPYKHSQAISVYSQSTFCLLLYKGICCGYLFELHRLVDAIHKSMQFK